jgi:class 3 adenylate cyclase/predicted ATPase
VSTVAEWLASLGLSDHAELFAQNDIDLSVLRHLTDQDLKELGLSLGHRRKMLAAIAQLAGAAVPSPLPQTTAAPEPKPQDTAERRQLTVMFCDLVGSTALSARMDPEDLREVILAYQRCVTEVVRRLDGFVAKYMGDGVLIYFGYPAAHEDDAERAVRAGLDLIAAVTRLKAAAPLETRVGIATGLVVVGDLIGSGEAQERGIVGETPNLAARLQGIAEPNTVVIAEGTRRLLGNLFELRDLEASDLRGIAGPTRAWVALRQRAVESRFEALHATELTALVGRDEEMELLLRRWSRAKTGESQVVLITGEAGIGKSRLTAALLERVSDEPHTRLRYFCSPQHTASALYPVIGQMERAAGLAHDDTPGAKLDKLDAVLAQTSTRPEDAALFAEMLSLPNDGRYPTLDLDPQRRRQRTMQALISQVEFLARQHPVLMVFEDAHWTDPTSLELFGRFVDRISTLGVLLIVTFRPEFTPPWIGQPHVTFLTVNRLAEGNVGAMVDRLIGNQALPASLRQDIIERTDGIPLFVEEMTRAVLEAESEDEARRTAASVPSPRITVPATLQASLMARLDRLGAAKEVAQVAAAIGREFSHALLAAVVGKPEAELSLAIDRLVAAGLLFRQGAAPHATYLFKHALVQDAAYGTLLREPRRALHARIAEAFESEFPEIVESQPELVARHCTEAGLVERAAALWGKAGLQSLARSALAEAAAQLKHALAQIAALPATPALRREQIKLQVALANALMHVKGNASSETRAAVDRAGALFEEADALGEAPEDALLPFSVLYGFWVANFVAFNGDRLWERAKQFMALAQKQGGDVPLVIGHRIMGNSALFMGDIAQARTHYDRGIALYDPAAHRLLTTRFGYEAGVAVLCYRTLAVWLLGYPQAALADARRALDTSREMGQVINLMLALGPGVWSQIYCGEYASAITQTAEILALAEEKGTVFGKAIGLMNRGWLHALTGEPVKAIETMTAGLAAYRSAGSTVWFPLFLPHMATSYAELGRFDDARRCIEEAMAAMETTKEQWCEADVHRIAGEITLMLPEPDLARAQSYFDHALASARARQAKAWELRAAMSMARLWRDQGKRQQAHDLLAPIHGWFTEGFDTLDLKQAKALLNELSA